MSRIWMSVSLLLMAAASQAVAQQTLPANCQFLPGPSVYLVCGVGDVNAPLVIYAHGYVAPDEALGIPWSQLFLSDGTFLPTLVNSLGYAFAVTSYPKNGLAIVPGVTDLTVLLDTYIAAGGKPSRVYLAGVSEGGLVATKALETYPEKFDGGLALCGPIGDFRKQLNHVGDFRDVFDYYFPHLLPGNAIFIPDPLPKPWPDLITDIRAAQVANPLRFAQPYKVTSLPVNPADVPQSAVDLLWYSIFATDDANAVLGGNPYDNRLRWYFGSTNDFALNFGISRFAANSAALAAVQAGYQTTGHLSRPLVTMHTTGDPIVPYWHEPLYGMKVLLSGSLRNYVHIPIVRYGHCSFQPAEILFGFAVMVGKSGGGTLSINGALTDENERALFHEMERRNPQQ